MEQNPTEVSQGLGGGFWSSVVTGGTGLINSFNYKAQDKQIELANAQAEIARAQADAAPKTSSNKTVIAIAIVIAVIAVAYFFTRKNKA